MSQPTALVTGGAGFIGANVTSELLRAGYSVVVLDDLSGGKARYVPDSAHFVQGDICDASLVESLFARFRFEYVFHFAAYAAEGLSHFIKRFNYTNNVVGSVSLINAAVNAGTVRCFVFTSSIAVYGSAVPPMTEDMIPVPGDPYGIAKLAVEHELRVTREMFGLPYIIFRPHNVYGEYQNIGDRYRNVIGIFMNQALRSEPFTIFGDGKQLRAFSYIGDVAPTIARSVAVPEAYNEILNIGGDRSYSINTLAHRVAVAMDVPLRVSYLPGRNEVQSAYATHNKVRKILNLTSEAVPLDVGLARMADWVQVEGPEEPSVFEDVEVRRNLPPSWLAALRR